jgi:tetratricopeptide (TPR) repeat protein
MKKKFAGCIILIFASLQLFAQNELDPKVFYKFGNFDQALQLYLKEHPSKATDLEINFRIGFCYLNTNSDKAEALQYIKFAHERGHKDKDILLYVGQAYMYNHDFSTARDFFEQYKNSTKSTEDKAVADKHISFCNNAEKYMKDPINVRFVNLGRNVNTEKSEFMPQIDYAEEFVVYNTNQRYISDFNEYIMDIYWAQNYNGRWRRGKSVSSRINSTDYEYLAGSGMDLSEIFLMPDTYQSTGDLIVSLRNGKRFDAPVAIAPPVNDPKATENSATISPCGDTLFFASDRPGGFGGFDLYYSLRIGGGWGLPINMGETINTPYNDAYPQYNPDGYFYFASEGHSSMGGYDVFRTKYDPMRKEWAKPENIGYPLNTVFDDYNISISTNGRHGYVAQIRPDGLGEYDIYQVIFNEADPTFLTYIGFIAVGDTASYTVVSSLDMDISIRVFRRGEEVDPYGEYSYSKTSGNYVIALPPGTFDLVIQADGFETIRERLVIPEVKHTKPFVNNNIFLTPAKKEQPKKPATPQGK